jgi:hypothetical protein
MEKSLERAKLAGMEEPEARQSHDRPQSSDIVPAQRTLARESTGASDAGMQAGCGESTSPPDLPVIVVQLELRKDYRPLAEGHLEEP